MAALRRVQRRLRGKGAEKKRRGMSCGFIVRPSDFAFGFLIQTTLQCTRATKAKLYRGLTKKPDDLKHLTAHRSSAETTTKGNSYFVPRAS